MKSSSPATRPNQTRSRQPRRTLGIAAIFCAAFGFAAQGVAQTAAHPLTGTWSWTLFDGKCTETLQYRGNGSVLATSAESVVESNYEATPQAGEKGFYKVVEQATRVNGKKDCYGDVMRVGDAIHTRYLQFNPANDKLIVCRTESLDACFGPLQKVR